MRFKHINKRQVKFNQRFYIVSYEIQKKENNSEIQFEYFNFICFDYCQKFQNSSKQINLIIPSRIMRYNLFLLLLIQFLLFCCLFCQINETDSINKATVNQQSQPVPTQIDKKRFEQINFIISSYFQNCKLDQASTVLYDCSIKRENYAEFLYALFHKELVMNFLKLYQSQGKLQEQNKIEQMYKIGQKVHQMVVSAYRQWMEVYKPNHQISVQQMYGDIVDLDSNVLDVIEHYPQQHQDFIKVLKNIYKISNLSKKYIVMGSKSQQEIAQDFKGISQIYFGNCKPITNCSLSLKAFVYFVKQISFYITPLIQQLQNRQNILVSQKMDFKATQFLNKKIQKLQNQLGQSVQYSQVQEYARDLAMDLFYFLKQDDDAKQSGGQQMQKKDISGTSNIKQENIQL